MIVHSKKLTYKQITLFSETANLCSGSNVGWWSWFCISARHASCLQFSRSISKLCSPAQQNVCPGDLKLPTLGLTHLYAGITNVPRSHKNRIPGVSKHFCLRAAYRKIKGPLWHYLTLLNTLKPIKQAIMCDGYFSSFCSEFITDVHP